MTEDDDFNRLVRRTAFTTVALGFALVFGIMLLVGGDRIPGGIIVGSTLVGLAVEIPVIRRLCGRPGTSSPRGSQRRRHPPAPHA